jgi:hypothetical protein
MANPMNIEVEVRDIKQRVIEISKKIDNLMYEREITAMMKLTEKSLSGFFEDEKDIYKISDLKVRYK